MKGSWKVATIAGIEIRLHFTFPLLLIWIAASHYAVRKSWDDVFSATAFILALFTIVVLHELGHALTARRYGIATRDITLLPIGGVARLERIPDNPKEELLVALAGPAVNVVLALFFFVILLLTSRFVPVTETVFVGANFIAQLMWVNVVLVLFNMLPAFPMDGGRVLRALLAMRLPYVRATTIAANIGQGMAWLLGILGLFTNPFLIIIAMFVWIGAAQEAGVARMRSALTGVPVRDVMVTDFRTLNPNDRLSDAVAHILSGFQQDFPVVDGGRAAGVLTRADLLKGISKGGQDTSVGDFMQRDYCTAAPGEMVHEVMGKLGEERCQTVLVLQNDDLVGVLNAENLGEFFMIQSALNESPHPRQRVRVGYSRA